MRETKKDIQKRYEELVAERHKLLDVIKHNEEVIALLKGRHHGADDVTMAASQAIEAVAHVSSDLRQILMELWRRK